MALPHLVPGGAQNPFSNHFTSLLSPEELYNIMASGVTTFDDAIDHGNSQGNVTGTPWGIQVVQHFRRHRALARHLHSFSLDSPPDPTVDIDRILDLKYDESGENLFAVLLLKGDEEYEGEDFGRRIWIARLDDKWFKKPIKELWCPNPQHSSYTDLSASYKPSTADNHYDLTITRELIVVSIKDPLCNYDPISHPEPAFRTKQVAFGVRHPPASMEWHPPMVQEKKLQFLHVQFISNVLAVIEGQNGDVGIVTMIGKRVLLKVWCPSTKCLVIRLRVPATTDAAIVEAIATCRVHLGVPAGINPLSSLPSDPKYTFSLGNGLDSPKPNWLTESNLLTGIHGGLFRGLPVCRHSLEENKLFTVTHIRRTDITGRKQLLTLPTLPSESHHYIYIESRLNCPSGLILAAMCPLPEKTRTFSATLRNYMDRNETGLSCRANHQQVTELFDDFHLSSWNSNIGSRELFDITKIYNKQHMWTLWTETQKITWVPPTPTITKVIETHREFPWFRVEHLLVVNRLSGRSKKVEIGGSNLQWVKRRERNMLLLQDGLMVNLIDLEGLVKTLE